MEPTGQQHCALGLAWILHPICRFAGRTKQTVVTDALTLNEAVSSESQSVIVVLLRVAQLRHVMALHNTRNAGAAVAVAPWIRPTRAISGLESSQRLPGISKRAMPGAGE